MCFLVRMHKKLLCFVVIFGRGRYTKEIRDLALIGLFIHGYAL